MAKSTASYGNDSIRQLKDEQRVRMRPAVIFGSDGLDGCAHAVFEILSNSVDEARQGYGNLITVTKFADGSIQVEDNGRGCPLDWNPSEKRFNWELVFCELYAGGKYDNNDGGDYDYSLGTNGLGSCATQYASEYMDVTVWREGNKYDLHFAKGKVIGSKKKALNVEPTDEKRSGTTIKWRPDLEVFTAIDIPREWFEETLRRQAVVNANVTFRLRVEGIDGFEEQEYCYPKGIEDYILEKTNHDYLTEPFFIETNRRGRDRDDLPDYNVKITACFCFSRGMQLQEYYHNSSWLENGGSPEKAARSAFTSAIDGAIKKAGKYKKNESTIKWQDVQDCLVLVTNCFSTQTSYENQTKKAINNKFIQQAMTAFIKEQMETYLIENKTQADKIVEQVLINKRSRENAEKTRQSIKTNLQQKTDMANRVQKFIDCRSKDRTRREVYIVEGDSAAGACRTSRDAEFQGVMPVRGKILNCLKEDYPRIFKSEIIMDLLRVLGCGVEVNDKRLKNLGTFDLENLNWNKVIICTDADVDGYHIRTLILTMLYRLVPTLIREGYVFIAESPLYEINCKEKTYFAYTDMEKNKILEEIGDQKCSINRSKGLGENDPDMMWLTTMNPDTRRLIKVLPEDVEQMEHMFNLLLGNDDAGRKKHIAEHGKEYLDQLDLQ
ncbi:DNA topoisomerase [Denitrobacterium detoxificans]|uniref:DNA topoisomerase (ATP-hydrolyzing) n=1 Tax=Denitrobacterium detoxificans TaxID=79604 RepID=A0A172RX22_9ACTN|nr:toprim domain-containing protein [Denitrobacterium detoxificans]ANE22301.1 DNA topoisomerase [Denitrobacterium detoxificans]SEO62090.1 DNA gyrase subunit B [Denitrobacterium detoxificans]